MKKTIKKYITPIICLAVLCVMVAGCKKDSYYKDGGLANAKFNGTVLQYLQSNPKFDTIAQIVKLAGLEDVFSKEDITFFAPTDEVVRRTIGIVNGKIPYLYNGLNQALFDLHKDTIKTLDEIPQAIWRKYLMRYVFKGKSLLKDYPQLDFDLRPLYPGGYYYGYNGDLANIGVVYGTVNTIKYAGYRRLTIASVVDPSNPKNYYYASAMVSSSDIQPTNGVVHTLAVMYGPPASFGGSGTFHDTTDGVIVYVSTAMENNFGMTYDFNNDVLLSR